MQAVLEAWSGRKPTGMSWALAHAAIGYNRRAVYSSGKAVMYGRTTGDTFRRIEGYEDHGVELLFFWNDSSDHAPRDKAPSGGASRQLSGIVVNIACPSQETEGLSKVSADFWHEVRQELRKRHGKDLFVLPQCAAAGDLSPHLMFRKRAEQIRDEGTKRFVERLVTAADRSNERSSREQVASELSPFVCGQRLEGPAGDPQRVDTSLPDVSRAHGRFLLDSQADAR